jgi:hypothetical protein
LFGVDLEAVAFEEGAGGEADFAVELAHVGAVGFGEEGGQEETADAAVLVGGADVELVDVAIGFQIGKAGEVLVVLGDHHEMVGQSVTPFIDRGAGGGPGGDLLGGVVAAVDAEDGVALEREQRGGVGGMVGAGVQHARYFGVAGKSFKRRGIEGVAMAEVMGGPGFKEIAKMAEKAWILADIWDWRR